MKPKYVLLLVLASFFFGVTLIYLLADLKSIGNSASSEKKPLYWVAPMDPNYKSSQPGKSPMGMDLVPVYEESKNAPGEVSISSTVENNLGVRIARVEHKKLHEPIKTVGYVKYDENELIHVHPRVEGWIENLFVKAAGNPVDQDAPLYSLYSPTLVNAQEELLLALNHGDTHLIKVTEERLRALKIPEKFIQNFRKNRKVEQTVTFYTPQKGIVDNLNIREGFYVQPGTTLMSIANLDVVWVEAEVFERQVSQVSVGLPVSMTLDYLPNQSWKGSVDYIYPTLNSQTRTARVRLRFSNTSHALKPNMFAQVLIHTEAREVTVIPREALIRTGMQERVVLALGDGKFKSIEIESGQFFNDYVEIISGLKVGEQVVTSAQFLLDSESSKSADFKRMSQNDKTKMVDEEAEVAWVNAEIAAIASNRDALTLTHGPINEWGMQGMTMNFSLAEGLDIHNLDVGMHIRAQLSKAEGLFRVVAFEVQNEGP